MSMLRPGFFRRGLRATALAIAKGIGCTRAGKAQHSFRRGSGVRTCFRTRFVARDSSNAFDVTHMMCAVEKGYPPEARCAGFHASGEKPRTSSARWPRKAPFRANAISFSHFPNTASSYGARTPPAAINCSMIACGRGYRLYPQRPFRRRVGTGTEVRLYPGSSKLRAESVSAAHQPGGSSPLRRCAPARKE